MSKQTNILKTADLDIGTDNFINIFFDNYYEGNLKNEPFNSTVRGVFINNLFYGTIWSKEGNFHIESSKSFLKLNDSSLIIYQEKHVLFDELNKFLFFDPIERSRVQKNQILKVLKI